MAGSRAARLVVGAVLSLGALAVGAGMSAASAASTWIAIAETGLPGHLELRSKGALASLLTLSPGEVKRWQINASLVDPIAPLTLQVWRDGELTTRADGLQLLVQACNAEWGNFPTAPTCPGATTVIGPIAASHASLGIEGASGSDMPILPVGTVTEHQDKFLLISVWLPDTPAVRADESLMGLEAELGLGLHVEGGGVVITEVPEDPRLAETGIQVVGGALTAAGAIGLGVLFMVLKRRSREPGAQL